MTVERLFVPAFLEPNLQTGSYIRPIAQVRELVVVGRVGAGGQFLTEGVAPGEQEVDARSRGPAQAQFGALLVEEDAVVAVAEGVGVEGIAAGMGGGEHTPVGAGGPDVIDVGLARLAGVGPEWQGGGCRAVHRGAGGRGPP